MKGLVKVGLIVYVAGGLVACGQKGPLVLPDAPKRKHTIPTLPAPKTAPPVDQSPAPQPGSPAVTPAPPASSSPTPNSTPPQP